MTSSANTATIAVSSRLSDRPNGAGLLLRFTACSLSGGAWVVCDGAPIAALLGGDDEAGGGPMWLGVTVGDAGGGFGVLLEPATGCATGRALVVLTTWLEAAVFGLLSDGEGLTVGGPLLGRDCPTPDSVFVAVSELLVETAAVELGAPLESVDDPPLEDDGGQVGVLVGCGRLVLDGEAVPVWDWVAVSVCEPVIGCVTVAVAVSDGDRV
jgi:hypothetical protein